MSRIPGILAEGRIRDVALVTVLGIGQATAMGVAAMATRAVFAALHDHTPPAVAAFVLLGLAGCAVAGIEVLSRIRAESLGQSFARSLRTALYRHIAGLAADELARRRLGGLSLRFVGDLAAARGWVGLGLSRFVAAIVVLPGAGLALWLLHPELAVAGGLPVVVSLCLAVGLAVGLGGLHRSLRSRRARIAISMMERIAIAPALDLAGRTPKELSNLDDDSRVLKREAVARMTRISLLRALPQIGAALGGVAILWTAGVSGIPAADAAGALAVLAILVLPLRELADVWDRYCAWRIARSKLQGLFDRDSALRRVRPVGRPVPVRFADVRFRGLHIDGEIAAGALVFVAGPPGSGKSSLLSLAAGQDRPDTGRIDYGGSGDPLPRIACVTDGGLIMQGRLRRSLTLGIDPRPRAADIQRVAVQLGLQPLLDRIGGIRGRVGEGGRTLSGGEALRIALTRAVLSRPDLIVIDSPYLAADPKMGELVDRLTVITTATLLVSGRNSAGQHRATTIEMRDGKAIIHGDRIRADPFETAA